MVSKIHDNHQGKLKHWGKNASGVFFLSSLWLHYLADDLGRAVIFSRPLSGGEFVDLKYSQSHRACCVFKYSLVKHLTGHIVIIGVGQKRVT